MPEATLGAIVIVAVFGMMKIAKMRQLWQLRRVDFWLAMIALVGVLVVPTLEALGIAVVASLGILVWRASEPVVILLDLSLTPDVDVPVVEAEDSLRDRLAADGIELWLCHLRPDAMDLLDRAGTLDRIGTPRVYPRVVDGILAYVLRLPGARERVAVLTDLLAFIDGRAAEPGTSPEGVETLRALERRLAAELAATEAIRS